MDLADPAVSNQLAGAAEIPVRTLLAARLPHDLVCLDSLDHGPALGNRQRERLLAVDVFLRPRSVHGDQGMPVVRGTDVDRVDVLAADDIAKIFVALTALVLVVPVDLANSRLTPADRAAPIARPLLVYIADGDDTHPLVAQEAAHPVGAVITGADKADRRLIARGILPHERNSGDRRNRDCGSGSLLQKATAGIRTRAHDVLLSLIVNGPRRALS